NVQKKSAPVGGGGGGGVGTVAVTRSWLTLKYCWSAARFSTCSPAVRGRPVFAVIHWNADQLPVFGTATAPVTLVPSTSKWNAPVEKVVAARSARSKLPWAATLIVYFSHSPVSKLLMTYPPPAESADAMRSTSSPVRYWPPALPATLSWYATPSPPLSKFSASMVPGMTNGVPRWGVDVGGGGGGGAG